MTLFSLTLFSRTLIEEHINKFSFQDTSTLAHD